MQPYGVSLLAGGIQSVPKKTALAEAKNHKGFEELEGCVFHSLVYGLEALIRQRSAFKTPQCFCPCGRKEHLWSALIRVYSPPTKGGRYFWKTWNGSSGVRERLSSLTVGLLRRCKQYTGFANPQLTV